MLVNCCVKPLPGVAVPAACTFALVVEVLPLKMEFVIFKVPTKVPPPISTRP